MEASDRRRRHRWFRDFWRLAKPFWTSEQSLTGVLYSLGILVYVSVSIYVNFLINKNSGEFMNSVANRSVADFYQSILTFLWIAIGWLVVGQTGHYLRYRLKLLWREWMTRRFLELWFAEQKHYFWNLTQRKEMDNPDQRIADDIGIFVNVTIQLTLDSLENILNASTYATILWGLSGIISIPLGQYRSISIPGFFMWLSLGFATISNVLVYFIGRKLVPLEYEQQHREADFRFSLMKMRGDTEAIALSGGENSEVHRAMDCFALIVTNFRALIRKFIQLEAFDEIHGRLKWVCVALAAGPRVLSGAMTVGGLTQTIAAFKYFEEGVGMLVASFRSFADWRSAARRLVDFEESLSRAESVEQALSKTLASSRQDGAIGATDLQIHTPDGRELINRLCLEIREGEHVMFKGTSGTGKSTLFRVFAGIWPFFKGSIKIPQRTDATFLSQTPYLPQGTLRHVIVYPVVNSPVSNEVIASKLQQFGLINLTDKLDVEEDWQKVLSPGEQQRVVLIRALLQKPKWLFLDEATTALDANNQALAYEILTNELKGTSIISISHQKDLERFHQRTIQIDKNAVTEPEKKIS